MNEELLALFRAAGQRGEFKDEAGAKKWLRSRGFDEFGLPLESKGSPFLRGLGAGVGRIGVGGTAERLSRAFGMPSEMWREMSMVPGQLEAERGMVGTAPRPLGLFERRPETTEDVSRQFSSGAALGSLGTEVGKAYGAGKLGALAGQTARGARLGSALSKLAPGVARFAARANPWTLAGITALGAVEDVGSLPEESTAGMLSMAAKGMGFPRVASGLESVSESALGRALTGMTLGILPESAILGAPSAYRRLQRAFGLADESAPAPRAVAPVTDEAPRFPEGASTENMQFVGEVPERPVPNIYDTLEDALDGTPRLGADIEDVEPLNPSTLLDEILRDLPAEPKRSTPLAPAGRPTRRVATGVAEAERAARAQAEQQVGEFNRLLTGAAAEAQRAEVGRGATRLMEPIEAQRQAQQIRLRRNKERAAATTTQQKAAVERMHAAENARLEGTPLGEALKRLAPAALVGGVGLGALSQLDEETGPAGAMLAGAFLPGMGRSLLRRPGRMVNPAGGSFLDRAYSRLETGVLNAKQERMPGRDWVNALKGSVPKSEMEWTGLGRFLDENADRTISRDDVADYLAQNRLEISERVVEPEFAATTGERSYGFSDYGAETTYDATTRLANRSNYRDVLFTFEPRNKSAEYVSPHYNEPNTLMHLRMFDVDAPEGKTLFVQEMQSDLHQQARKAGGYKTQEYLDLDLRRRSLDKASYDLQYNTPEVKAGVRRKFNIPETESDADAAARLKAEGSALKQELDARFPRSATERPVEAPFATTEEWTELGFKRALDEAVSGGYDRIVLANWPQITKATVKSDVFDDVMGLKVTPGSATVPTRVQPIRPGRLSAPAIDVPDNNIARFVDDPDIVRQFNDAVARGASSYDEVIVLRPESGQPFTVGDKQLRPYYDEKIPSVIKKYLGSLGVKAELKKVNLPMQGSVRGAARTKPNMALELTDEIRQKVLAGQRLLAPALIAGGATAAAAAGGDEAQADADVKRAGFEMGYNLPTLLALGLAGGAARSIIGRVGAARATVAAEKAAKQVDLTQIARESAELVQSQEQAARRATRVARATQRIAEPTGPRPVDAWNSPKTPTDVFRFAARIASDPEGLRAVSEATEQALTDGLVRGGKITWETEKAIASKIGVDAQDLALRDPSRTLSGPEFLALSNAYEAESRRKILLRQVMDNPLSTVDEKRLAEQLYDVVDTRATTIFQRLVRDRGETGRMLNLMKAVKAQSTNPADWLYKAQKLAGGRSLSPEMASELIRAIERGEFVKAKMVLNRAKAANTGFLDKAGEFFQTALLSRIGRPFRDLISNSVNSLDRRAQYAIGSMLDRGLNGFKVFPTRVMAGTPSQINAAGKRGARLGWQQALELLRASPTREITPEALDALERAARRYDFADESSFTNPFLRAWGTFVRRTIAASDQPFYESAFAMAMETQARAMGANMKLKGRALDEFVESTLANPPSEMVTTAIAEGAEAVFQNQTTLGRAAAAIGGRGAKNPIARFAGKQFVPFAQTPSAIATQAVEQTPLGLLNAAPEALLAVTGSTKAQREFISKLAKVSTGAAWMWLGYYLSDEGQMNLFYPDDPNERARWQEENRIANSILVNGKWVALSGLLGPQAMLLTIGGLVRDYMEKDAKSLTAAVTQASAVGTAEGFIETPAMQGVSSIMDILKAATQDDPARMEEALGRSLESQVTGYIPGIVQQVAAMGDVDAEGRVIMRDPMAGETLTEDLMNALKMGIPGQRETLEAKVSPFGRIRSSGPGGLESLVTPLRTTVSQETPLTRALSEIGYFPSTPPRNRNEGETLEMYNLRRLAEGPQDRGFLEALLAGDEAAWQFVSPQAQEEYETTQNAAELVRAALRSYRAARTREQREQ